MAKRSCTKGRKGMGRFLALPYVVLNHQDYLSLSHYARSLLIDIAMQYNGSNNGNLGASWTVMKKRGWASQDTLSRKLKELLDKGFIVKSRQGGLHQCNLYAITWQAVNECRGKQLDIPETKSPARKWK